jgi:multidrug efflux pump subunit AcrA (membrane-fusion protein)
MPGPHLPPTRCRIRSLAWALVIGGISVSVGCLPSVQEASSPPPKTLPTREAAVYRVRPQPWPLIVRSQGVLVADEVALVGTKVAGSVAKVHFNLGDFVRSGAPLVELDQEQFQLQIEQAEAMLAQSRSAIGLKPEQSVASIQPQNSPPVRQEQALWDEAKANLERAKQRTSLLPPNLINSRRTNMWPRPAMRAR